MITVKHYFVEIYYEDLAHYEEEVLEKFSPHSITVYGTVCEICFVNKFKFYEFLHWLEDKNK